MYLCTLIFGLGDKLALCALSVSLSAFPLLSSLSWHEWIETRGNCTFILGHVKDDEK